MTHDVVGTRTACGVSEGSTDHLCKVLCPLEVQCSSASATVCMLVRPMWISCHTIKRPCCMQTARVPACRTFIGVRNRATKKLRLMPAAGHCVATVQPCVHDVAYEGSTAQHGDTDEVEKRRQLNASLVQAFGSTRRFAAHCVLHWHPCIQSGENILPCLVVQGGQQARK